MLQFAVDTARCNKCGECVRDCLAGIIDFRDDGVPSIAPEKEPLCIGCQHCLAVCPEGAVSIHGKSAEDCQPLQPDLFPTFDQLSHLVRGRRSYRHYTAENVDRMLISRLIATLENAPTGVNVRDLTFTLIDDIDAMRRFQSLLIAGVRSDRSGSMLPERYSKLRELSDDQMIARIFRCAPHAIIVSSPPSAPCASEDTALTIAYFDLLAQSAGLGCVWWGMLRYFASAMPQIKAALGLPEDHIYSAALFGYPAIKYARTANRDGSATIRRLTAADFRESE